RPVVHRRHRLPAVPRADPRSEVAGAVPGAAIARAPRVRAAGARGEPGTPGRAEAAGHDGGDHRCLFGRGARVVRALRPGPDDPWAYAPAEGAHGRGRDAGGAGGLVRAGVGVAGGGGPAGPRDFVAPDPVAPDPWSGDLERRPTMGRLYRIGSTTSAPGAHPRRSRRRRGLRG